MGLVWEGIKKAAELLWTLDPEVLGITLFSLKADADQKSFDCTLQIARYFKGVPSS